jgi:8-oxo-dGTP pyrophosphatase MutT (NUDIX family)
MNEYDIRARLSGLSHAPLALEDYWPSAVLVPLEVGRGVWLTLRASHLNTHAGQVAFPGGRIETSDSSPEAAALREASEEIGLRPEDATIIGRMDDYITATGFHMIPVLALVTPGLKFVAAADEVSSVFCLSFADLLNPAAPQLRTAAFKGMDRQFWVWTTGEHLIWGATAEILVNLARRLRGD